MSIGIKIPFRARRNLTLSLRGILNIISRHDQDIEIAVSVRRPADIGIKEYQLPRMSNFDNSLQRCIHFFPCNRPGDVHKISSSEY